MFSKYYGWFGDYVWWNYITCKTQNFCILLTFLLITMALLIAVSILLLSDQISSQTKTPFHDTNNKLNKFYIDSINWKWVIKLKI